MSRKYQEIYDNSINNREEFWQNISKDIFWYKKPTKILNSSNPPFYKWFEDGVTNTCYNALDHHIVQGRGEKLAIIYDSPITGVKTKISYKFSLTNYVFVWIWWINLNFNWLYCCFS